MADTDAWEPDASAAVADEWLGGNGWRPQDHPPACDREEGIRRTEGDREASWGPPPDGREARAREAKDGEARENDRAKGELGSPLDDQA